MKQRRALFFSLLAGLSVALPSAALAQAGPGTHRAHKVVFQVSDADPARWNLTLNNIRNVQQDLGADLVAIELVAYGPGIGMLKLDSVSGSRVAEAMASGVAVVACENTMRNQRVTREDMLPNIGYVAAGVVELMSKQREGYAYIRP